MNSDYRSARAAAILAARQKPRDLQVAKDTINKLRAFNLAKDLIDYVDRLGPLDRLPILLLLVIASNYSALGEQQRALECLDEARRGDPDFPPTLMSRAQVLMYLGRKQEARDDLGRCLRRAPEIAQAQWIRSRLDRQTGDSNHVHELHDRLERAGTQLVDASFLAFALHKELDDIGDIAGAWRALETACRAKRKTLDYDPDTSRKLMGGLMALDATAAAVAGDEHEMTGAGCPIFIVGMHRSGTTLLEQLLDASPQVRSLGELYDFTSAMRYEANHYCRGVLDAAIVARVGNVDFAEVGRRYLEGLAWRLGDTPFFTDKLPSNFLNIGFICRALPQAKLLHMVRDPVETCFSNLRELFSDACPYSYDQAELADYYLQYHRLMVHWHGMFPGRILDVDYARLTADPAAVMREVAQFCGIDYVDAMCSTASSSRAVATASAMQVRGDVVRREVPKWEPYRQYLQALIDALRRGGVEVPEGAS